tara:strand:- start:1099 stop:1407 length:309 start_codon:yes stop_codon:yes gene_type:complete
MSKHVTIAEDCEESTQEDITSETVITKENSSDELADTDEDYDGSEDIEESDFEPQMDFGQLLSNFFVTENGVNVADAIMELKESLDIHNKLLHKYFKFKSGR